MIHVRLKLVQINQAGFKVEVVHVLITRPTEHESENCAETQGFYQQSILLEGFDRLIAIHNIALRLNIGQLEKRQHYLFE